MHGNFDCPLQHRGIEGVCKLIRKGRAKRTILTCSLSHVDMAYSKELTIEVIILTMPYRCVGEGGRGDGAVE